MNNMSRTVSYKTGEAGFTLLELMLALGIVSLVMVAVTSVLITGIRYNGVIFDQLSAQSDGRKAVVQMIDDMRRAESSSTGAYAIAAASSTEFIFFANIDNDTARERVRYTLTATTVEKGIIKATGTPLTYPTSSEKKLTIAKFVTNQSGNVPLFTYFPGSYAGTSTPLTYPLVLTNIRLAKVKITIEKDANKSPVPITVEGTAEIRSLKTY